LDREDRSGTAGSGNLAASLHPAERATDALFELRGACYSYDDSRPALRDVWLMVRPGESLAVLGSNGSGKSTLLKMLDGLVHPTSGTFRAFGEEITRESLRDQDTSHRFRRRVALVFQNPDTQLFSATVREEMAFGPLHLRLSPEEIEQRIADVAGMLDIEGLLDRHPFQLSGGEKRKVALASVLVVNPEVLLLDEPTSQLDPRSRGWLLDILSAIREAGKTLVMATNDLGTVPRLAQRAVVLNESHGMEATGPVGAILSDSRLLASVNVLHEHFHWHEGIRHAHGHCHDGAHAHDHDSAARPDAAAGKEGAPEGRLDDPGASG